MRTVCVIPARGNSKRIPGKNIKEFHGKPIIAYAIKTALFSGVFDDIYVSTDSGEIAGIAHNFGAKIIERPANISDDKTGTQAVMVHAMVELDLKAGFACCLYATTPLLTSSILRHAFNLLKSSSSDYVVPVAEWLRDPGQFYFGKALAFRWSLPLLGSGTRLINVPLHMGIDINTMEDWSKAESVFAKLLGIHNELNPL